MVRMNHPPDFIQNLITLSRNYVTIALPLSRNFVEKSDKHDPYLSYTWNELLRMQRSRGASPAQGKRCKPSGR